MDPEKQNNCAIMTSTTLSNINTRLKLESLGTFLLSPNKRRGELLLYEAVLRRRRVEWVVWKVIERKAVHRRRSNSHCGKIDGVIYEGLVHTA